MGGDELREQAEQTLGEARALRAAFPDAVAMQQVHFTTPAVASGATAGTQLRAALRYLRDEMVTVRDGRAADLTVLNDEVANVERLLWATTLLTAESDGTSWWPD